MMKQKYYVTNDKVRVIVLADSPLAACCEALSYMGFTDSTDIPDTIISWNKFAISYGGFRYHNVATPVPSQFGDDVKNNFAWPEFLLHKDLVLARFDKLQRSYDPFCEYGDENRNANDEYFDELGGEA